MDGTQAPIKSHRLESRYGSIIVPETDDLIINFLDSYGEWGWNEARFVALGLQEGARVLDGGAFLGTFSLGLAENKRLGFLCAVEANSSIVPLLEENVRENVAEEIVVIDAMLAGTNTDPRPGHHEPSNLGSTSFVAHPATDRAVTEASAMAVTLTDLRQKYGPFDLIKLDIEGMEEEVLLGDREYLSRGTATLWLECNETLQSVRIAEMLLEWGLDVYYFAFPSHNPNNFRGLDEPIYPWAYEAGLLVTPAREPHLDAAMHAHGCILRRIGCGADLCDALWRTPRWLPVEFAHASSVELAAAAGRALRGQSRESFLSASPSTDPSAVGERLTTQTFDRERFQAEHHQRQRAEAALVEAQAYVIQRDLELQIERDRRECAESTLREAQAFVAERTTDVQIERQRRETGEVALAEAQAYVARHLEDLQTEHDRRELAERALTEAQTCLAERTTTLHAECEQRERAEAALAEAQAYVVQRNEDAQVERDRRECAETALTEAQAVVTRTIVEAELEAARCSLLERGLANTTALALSRLADFGRERERVEAALMQAQLLQANLDAATAQLERTREQVQSLDVRCFSAEANSAAITSQLRATEARLDAHERTLAWRVVAPVHRFVGRHPGLHRRLRGLRAVVRATLKPHG